MLRACVLMAGILIAGRVGALSIEIQYVDPVGEGFFDSEFGAARRVAFEYAIDRWRTILDGSVPIVVTAQMPSAGGDGSSALLASAGPVSVHRGFPGSPSSVWYAAALANQLRGDDVNGGDQAEIRILFNADIDRDDVLGSVHWYYGLDAQSGADFDFVTVALHELGHGLGFIQGVDVGTGEWLAGNSPSVLDTLLVRDGVGDFASLSAAERRAAVLSSGGLRWSGAGVVAFNGDTLPVFAPDPFIPGSSVGHWDPDRAPGELMGPSYAGPQHDPGALVPALVDLGWRLAVASPTPRAPPATPTATPSLRPTPGFAWPSGPERLYVTNFDDGTVSVIDAASRAPVPDSPIAVGGGPIGVAVGPDGRRVYVADLHSGTLIVISTRTHRVLARVGVGDSANAVAVTPDGAFAVVTDTAADRVAVVATSVLETVARVPVGPRPSGVALDPDGRRAFIADFGTAVGAATMSVVNVEKFWREAIVSLVRGEGQLSITEAPLAVAIAGDGSGWVVAHRSRTAIGFNSGSYDVERFIASPAGANLPEAVAITRSGGVAYITSHVPVLGSGTVTVVDTADGAVVAQIAVGLVPEALALSVDESALYVANTGSGTVSIIDTSTRRVVGSVEVGSGPMGLAAMRVPSAFCAGDCNADTRVRVNELVTAVGIALGDLTIGSCEESDIDGDGRVDIAELIQSVSAAIAGCVEISALP
jgi:YVTN family beta-propeller protein